MSNLIEKTLFLGLGVLTMTRDKVVATVDELVKAGEVEASESRRLVDELVTKGEAEQKEIRRLINQEIDKLKKTVIPVSKEEIEALSQRIGELEQRVAELTSSAVEGDQE
ncbi:MAG: polyhydroxyalkanoate synthesis regulator [Chloroflexi bacterium]|nr:polyhydroxyalkanoate synthesis regulator [Chloroflexota bacterium]